MTSRRDLLRSGIAAGAAFMFPAAHAWAADATVELPLITKAIPFTGEKLPALGPSGRFGAQEDGTGLGRGLSPIAREPALAAEDGAKIPFFHPLRGAERMSMKTRLSSAALT